jgi:SNF2 family DNA or RNA helicase
MMKTMPCIRRIQMYPDFARALIVAPNSALGTWEDELYLEGEDDVVYLQGTRRQRLELLQEDHRWCLINKEGWLALPEIADVDWDVVVLDESTFIRNPKAKVTRFFLVNFRNVPHRWLLTGLPNPTGPLDYWCQLAFLDGGAFGCRSYWQFRAKYFLHNEAGYDWEPDQGVEKQIDRVVGRRAFVMQRRDAGIFMKKVRERRRLEFPADLHKAYRTAERDFVLELNGETRQTTLYSMVRWQWMRQMCGGYVERELVWPGKINELKELLVNELGAEQVVVWFTYNHELYGAAERLGRDVVVRTMTGATPVTQRRQDIRDFDKGLFRVFLIQMGCAQSGMKLSAADTAIYYSTLASLEARAQSEDRVLQIGKESPILILDLVVKGTVDEDMTDLLSTRRWQSQRALDRAVRERLEARWAS